MHSVEAEDIPYENLNVYLFYAISPEKGAIYHKIVFTISEELAYEIAAHDLKEEFEQNEVNLKLFASFPVSFFTRQQQSFEYSTLMSALKNTEKQLVEGEKVAKEKRKKSYRDFFYTLSYLRDKHKKWITKEERYVLNKLIAKCEDKSKRYARASKTKSSRVR